MPSGAKKRKAAKKKLQKEAHKNGAHHQSGMYVLITFIKFISLSHGHGLSVFNQSPKQALFLYLIFHLPVFAVWAWTVCRFALFWFGANLFMGI